MADRDKPPKIPAAGALLWRPGGQGPEVALVHRPRYDDWSFPKGKSLPGEHVLITAVREVTEETGIEIILGRRLRTVRYLSDGRPKQVDYWAAWPARAAGRPGESAEIPAFTPNEEVDQLEWLPLTAAGDRLSYEHDTEVLSEFASAPAATTVIILIRHASSRNKKAWQNAGHPDDLTRPLTPLGHVQAKLLGQILTCFGPARVISSPAERCLATVEPHASLTGGVVEPAPAFAPPPDGRELADAAPAAVAAARDLMTGLITASEPVVICGHRENLPALLRWACERLGAPVPAGPPLRKGAFWALHVAGGRLIAAEQHNLNS
jgi:8-oxo-dGTP pyrophosphatase MutT (NUDIX family)/phosphohistidine phosphatase SixA